MPRKVGASIPLLTQQRVDPGIAAGDHVGLAEEAEERMEPRCVVRIWVRMLVVQQGRL